MWILGVILFVAIAWYFAKHDHQVRVEIDSDRNARHQRELQEARRDEREKLRAEQELAELRANVERGIAYRSRIDRDPDFRAKVVAAEAQDEDAADALRVVHHQEAATWFKNFAAHVQREMKSNFIAERRARALEALTRDREREAERVNEQATALAARMAVDRAYREGTADRYKRRYALAEEDQQADSDAESGAAVAWLNELPETEQADLRARFRPKSRDEQLAAHYARDNRLPRGLTEATLAAFLRRARDTIEYANVERYAGLGERWNLLEHLEHAMEWNWSGLGDRSALEHLVEPAGEQKLLDWLLSELERKSEWARAHDL